MNYSQEVTVGLNYGYCLRCKKFQLNPEQCACKLYYCWYDGNQHDPNEMIEIFANDAGQAAETMAKRWYSSEMTPQEMTVWVQRSDSKLKQEYFIGFEIEVIFNSRLVNNR